MDDVDLDLERAEREASPDRFPEHSAPIRATDGMDRENAVTTAPIHAAGHATRASSFTSATTSSRQVVHEEMITGVSRVNTSRDLERHPTSLSRIQTEHSQHKGTVGGISTRTRESRLPLPAFGDAGKPYPPDLPNKDEYVVEFAGHDDPIHPQNWPMKKKIITSLVLGYTTLVAAFASSIFSAATGAVAEAFHVSVEVGILGLSLYVLGFATGPLVWAPYSELKGRRIPILIGMFGFTIFSVATGSAKDLQTVLITRFFAGVFSSCPLAVVGAVFSDMFNNETRGLAITLFSMTVFTGPLLAPFVGGFIIQSSLGWRWTEYIVTFMGGLAFILDFIFMEETYPPVVLVGKAAFLRRRTLNWGIHAKQEEIELDFRDLISKNFSRPLRILFTEPIVLLLSIYMGFIYGLLYLFLTAYPIVFQQIHGFGPGVGGLPLFGMVFGMLGAGVFIALGQPSYSRKLRANNNIPVPEWRLPPVMIGGLSFAMGLFWFGWSGYRADIHWIVPTLSGLLTGFGLLSIFLQSLNYIVDAYLML